MVLGAIAGVNNTPADMRVGIGTTAPRGGGSKWPAAMGCSARAAGSSSPTTSSWRGN
jgi:hypothetical protein